MVEEEAARGGDAVTQAAGSVQAGEPSQLLLWLWGRSPDAAVGVEGDVQTARALRERLVTATQ